VVVGQWLNIGQGILVKSPQGEFMRALALMLCSLALILSLSAKTRKDVPPAPLPEEIITSHKVFLSNGGGSDLAYDAFYSEIKKWGKYQIMGSPDDSELIIELSYRVDDLGTRVWSTHNTYYNTTQVHSREVTDPKLILTIYDAHTKNSLWSTVDHRKQATFAKNREKETVNSAERLVEELRSRSSTPQ
jgi:hypothetical protein